MGKRPIRKGVRKGRVSRRLPKKPLILIVCEGAITEQEYFNCLRKKKRISKDRIRVLTSKHCRGTDPKTLVVCAKAKRIELYKKEGLYYDTVWCVFDRDDHGNVHEALNQAKGNGFECAFSNPCFEIWCLLHFRMQSAHIERDRVSKCLRDDACLPGYDKRIESFFDILFSNVSEASRRAKELRQLHANNYQSEKSNPSTNVDELIDLIVGLN